ncbi:hypothetical protein AB1Y20_015520 [Prymnesium parvum]|uniref:Phosphoglycerate mutase n=1 Tax=Prymnesium parvum TaxID=97485 RepID=A0AB34K0P9_PRYPA
MLGHALANKGIDQFCHTVYSSDLSRARDTARAALSAFGSKGEAFAIQLDTRLRERSLGLFQGLTAAQCDQEHRAAWRTFNKGACRAELDSAGAIGVEDDEELQARALAALSDIVVKHAGETVVVVSHGGWIHAALACCAAQEAVPHIGNGSISTLILSADCRGWMKSGPENSHIRVGAAKGNVDMIGICGTVRSGK